MLSAFATLLLAPFGAFALDLAATTAATTAAIALGREAHADSDKRRVAAAAGLALPGTIGSGLAAALTFLAIPSGIRLFGVGVGVGSGSWGVVAGATALFVQQWRPRRDETSVKP